MTIVLSVFRSVFFRNLYINLHLNSTLLNQIKYDNSCKNQIDFHVQSLFFFSKAEQQNEILRLVMWSVSVSGRAVFDTHKSPFVWFFYEWFKWHLLCYWFLDRRVCDICSLTHAVHLFKQYLHYAIHVRNYEQNSSDKSTLGHSCLREFTYIELYFSL